jgi:hypothetical protein
MVSCSCPNDSGRLNSQGMTARILPITALSQCDRATRRSRAAIALCPLYLGVACRHPCCAPIA